MQQANNSSENLVKLFNERQYQRVLDISTTNEINPSNNPNEAYVVAASLFQIGKYDECLLWCEGLAPAIGSDAAFASMYGAVLRRLGKLVDAQNIFREALSIHTQDNVLKIIMQTF